MEKRVKIGLLIVILMLVLNIINEFWFELVIVYIASAVVAAYGLLLMFPIPKNEEIQDGEKNEQ